MVSVFEREKMNDRGYGKKGGADRGVWGGGKKLEGGQETRVELHYQQPSLASLAHLIHLHFVFGGCVIYNLVI